MKKVDWDPKLAIEMLNMPTNRFDDKAKVVRKNVYDNNLDVFAQWGYIAPSGREV